MKNNYSVALNGISNLEFGFSPRKSGEISSRSLWTEYSLQGLSFTERVNFIKKLASENTHVVFKTANSYGCARVWVKK